VTRACLAWALVAAALVLVPSAGAWRTHGYRWPSSTIGYYDLSHGYGWSLEQAAVAWDLSGAKVRFVPVPRARAQVIVGARLDAGDVHEAGEARVHVGGGRIHDAVVYIRDGVDRYTAAQILTHELGHVLGIAHDDRGCATMNSTLLGDHPWKCAPPPRGEWRCGLVTADDATAAVRLYGGRALAPPREFCPIR
jgi:hypothetical protein